MYICRHTYTGADLGRADPSYAPPPPKKGISNRCVRRTPVGKDILLITKKRSFAAPPLIPAPPPPLT